MSMIVQQLRKRGNSYTLTVPKDEVERRGWVEGQRLGFTPIEVEIEYRTKGLRPLDARPVLRILRAWHSL